MPAKMMTVRKDMGAHEEYADFRADVEILELLDSAKKGARSKNIEQSPRNPTLLEVAARGVEEAEKRDGQCCQGLQQYGVGNTGSRIMFRNHPDFQECPTRCEHEPTAPDMSPSRLREVKRSRLESRHQLLIWED